MPTKLATILFKEGIEQKDLSDMTYELFEVGVIRAAINKIVKSDIGSNTGTIIKITEALNEIIGKNKYTPNDIISGDWGKKINI